MAGGLEVTWGGLYKIVAADKAAENAINLNTWMYFRQDIESSGGEGKNLQDAYYLHKQDRMEKGLNKYTSVFSNIGFLLIDSLRLSCSLKKLMHGVE